MASLAERYGANIRLGELLQFLVGECRLWERQKRWNNQICGAYFIDLESPRPPDLPAGMLELRVVKGGGDKPQRNVQSRPQNLRQKMQPITDEMHESVHLNSVADATTHSSMRCLCLDNDHGERKWRRWKPIK